MKYISGVSPMNLELYAVLRPGRAQREIGAHGFNVNHPDLG